MSGQAKYCTKCGAQMPGDARFCTMCGTPAAQVAEVAPVEEPTPAPPEEPVSAAVEPEAAEPAAAPQPVEPQPAAPAEQIQGLIPNALLKGGFLGFASKPYILVLTERRIVFAHVTKEMMKQAVVDARDSAKADGKGFFGQWGAQLGAYSSIGERYAQMEPELILGETPENFAIERADIASAKLKAGHTDDEGHSTPDRLIIKAAGKKYDIQLSSGMRQAKEALVAAALI